MFSCTPRKGPGAFRVTIHDSGSEFCLAIQGSFTAGDANEVEQCWRTAASIIGVRAFVVDLSGVGSWDAAVADLVARMHESGARFIAGGLETARAVAAIAGCEPIQPGALAGASPSGVLAGLLQRLRTWTRRFQAVPHAGGRVRPPQRAVARK